VRGTPDQVAEMMKPYGGAIDAWEVGAGLDAYELFDRKVGGCRSPTGNLYWRGFRGDVNNGHEASHAKVRLPHPILVPTAAEPLATKLYRSLWCRVTAQDSE
jgi:hypothetical protein